MKKLLLPLLMALFAGAGSIYAQNSDFADASATANVLQAVSVTKVTDANLEFGDVFQNTPKPIAYTDAAAAAFDVTYTATEPLLLTFTLPSNLDEDGAGTATLPISFGTTDAAWDNGVDPNSSTDFDPNSSLALPGSAGDGDIRVWLGGTVSPGVLQTEGSYSGTITLTAAYN